MGLIMTFRIALKALNRNKLRTMLTMLGMIIGVGAVITMVALGNGAQATIEAQIQAAGTNLITVNSGNFQQGGVRQGFGMSTTLTPEDAMAIRELPSIEYVAPQVSTRVQVVAGNQNWSTQLEGTDVDLPAIRSWPLKYGTWFSQQDVQGAAKNIVLGTSVADILFPEGGDPTGQIIRVGRGGNSSASQPFRVIGVMSPKGALAMGGDQDDRMFALFTTVQKKLMGIQHVNNIQVSARAGQIDEGAEAIRTLLRVQHKLIPGDPDDFTVRTNEEIAATRTETTRTMTTLLAAIAGVSLLVGGIGIMNIMLVSVTERTREIGLRLAIGARGKDVLFQFLVEAVVISLVGGGIGIVMGFVSAEAVKRFAEWPAVVPANAIGVAFGFAAATGIFFGFYPARKASGLDPIEALRFE
jgi:putative ABC transport system permease protein